MSNLKTRRWVYVINGVVALLFLGCSYAWSVFIVPMEQEFGWVRSETSLAFTLNVILYSGGSLLAGVLGKKLSFAALSRIAAVMIGAGFCLTSFVTQPWQVYITYSFLCGCGIGIAYNCVVSAVPKWFPAQTGLISGILLVGYAMSTAIFGPTLSSLITSVGVALSFRILAAVCLVALVLTSFLIRSPSEQEALELPQPKQAAKEPARGVRPGQMVRMPVFYVNLVLSALLSGCGLALINHISPLMTEGVGATAAMASLVISLNSVLNSVGRLVGGWVYDKKGSSLVMGSIPVVEGLGAALLVFGLQAGSGVLCVCGSAVVLLGFGAAANMIPTMARDLFGEKFFSMNFPLVNLSCIGAACIPTLIGALQVASGNYIVPMGVLLGIDVLCFLLALLLIKLKKPLANR